MEISSNDQNQKNMNEIKTEKEENNSILNEDEENEIEEDRQSTLKEGDEQTQNIEEIQKINFPENTNDYQNMKISNNFNNNYITFGDINNLNNIKKIKKNKLNNKNDALSNILDKIKYFKENHHKKNKSTITEDIKNNNNLDTLNKEISLGLEKLNLNHSKQKNIENHINSNPKLKEIMYIINGETTNIESPTKKKVLRDFDYGINGVDDVYKYFNSKHNFKKRIKKGNLYNNYYISCIDGKAIINGARRDVSNKNLYDSNFDFLNFGDRNSKGIFSSRRNKSINFNKFFTNENNINKTAKLTKNNYLLNFDFDSKYKLRNKMNDFDNIKLYKLENDYFSKLNNLEK